MVAISPLSMSSLVVSLGRMYGSVAEQARFETRAQERQVVFPGNTQAMVSEDLKGTRM
jgi:hypothetical protein